MIGEHNEVTAGVWTQFTWRPNRTPNPLGWQEPARWEQEQAAARAEGEAFSQELQQWAPDFWSQIGAFNERFGTPQRVRAAHARRPAVAGSTWPGEYEPRDVIAIALGAHEPRWMNGTWWHDREHYPLANIASAAEVARIRVPDWGRLPVVQHLLASRERWQREHPKEPLAGFGLTWELIIPGQDPATAIFYPSFVDLGVYLMGMTQFLTILAGEPPIADALANLCFELSTSYTEFLLSLKPEPWAGLGGFGGDVTFALSPGLYPRYGAAWDARLFEFACARHHLPAGVPCNLHSCGASGHLYELWGKHPCLGNVTTMQTRLLPGQVKRLRSALPDVQLELTLHPPQFELTTATAAEIRRVLKTAAREAGGRDVHFSFIPSVHRPEDLARLLKKIAICTHVMEELRSR